MAFWTKGLEVIRERRKQESDRQDISFDCTNLPGLAAERIASFLDGKDLIRLGNTCKFWNAVTQRNIIWKTLVEKRFGRQVISDSRSQSQIEYKRCYFKLAESKKSATAFCVVWLNGKGERRGKRSWRGDSTQQSLLAINQRILPRRPSGKILSGVAREIRQSLYKWAEFSGSHQIHSKARKRLWKRTVFEMDRG